MTIYSVRSPLIGLASDRPGVGKTTAAEYLVETHLFHECSVGAAVKAEVDAMVRTHGFHYKEGQKEDFRDGLIWWTQFRVRHSSPDYWLRVIIDSVTAVGTDPIVVSDVRHPVEAEYIRSIGGVLIKISRPAAPVHASGAERELSGYPFDEIIDNSQPDGGRKMFGQLDKIVSDLRARILPGSMDATGSGDAS